MECAAKGRGTSCLRGPPKRRCGLCGAVAYCSKSHQMLHWSDHKDECSRLAQQMKHADGLSDFPFTFLGSGKEETRCSILTSAGLHRVELWKSECSCSLAVASSKSSWINDSWCLPSSLCPCSEPRSPAPTHMSSWKDYYQWRCLPFHSPAALLLHWPLTIYRCFQVSGLQNLILRDSNTLNIHYLGPEKELLQLGVFSELRALFPSIQLHIEFVGPAVPQFRDGEMISLCNYMHCSEEDCCCKVSSTVSASEAPNCSSSFLTVKLHKGFYHDRYEDIVKDSYPHLVVVPNAGIAAYSSWLPTIELLKDKKIPAVFTDFCEEAANLAAHCISSVSAKALRQPVQLNPFRQPLAVEDSALYLPCYSNCFLFGI
ncbi:uncharacterized protein A4U43_C04F12660 [Asparagus officinalis]|uniref:MYND-type domain-containing protein n=1 Tax=Asparagus officinalis TaxID=4686 RepID=A0A5P1F268_ASPOF|nr:zinc finger MYND domain-containing protein 15 [Asparagus officinalis]ONK71813.1 uncharacterized protein A4U43_C04F12660 [Asparagus officinalis]